MNKRRQWLRYLPAAVGIVLVIVLAVAVYLLKDLFQKPVQTKKQVQQITIIQPPPPPPPPPPEQKPPEPEVKEEKIEEPEPEKEPEPAPEEAEEPASDQLGVDAEGAAGGDAFGLVGHKGGRSLLGGTGGNAITWYGGQVSRGLEEQLQQLLADTVARKTSYTVQIDVWIGSDGRVSRAEMTGSSGKPEVDHAIAGVLPRLRFSLPKPPPENMPQPVKIRFSSRL